MFVEIGLFLLLVLVYAVLRDRRPRNCPPGPVEIPFFGRLPFFDEKIGENLRKKYGDIVSHRTGPLRSVYLFDYSTAKEAMARLEFADRPDTFSAFNVDDQKIGGVLGSNGAHWQHDRRFVLRNLRNLGMGKSYLEEAINIEAKALVEDLKKYGGEAINYPDSFRTVALNIIWQMVASTRYDLRCKDVECIYRLTNEFREKFTVLSLLPSFIPALGLLPKSLRHFLFGDDVIDRFAEEMINVVNEAVDKHLEDYDPDKPRDLIDEYIKDMKESEGDDNSLFRRGALNQIINELFFAGSDTVHSMMKWVAYLLARYPEYATRMQQQIDAVVPRDRMVSLDDKPNLPLIEAFTVEALRYSSMLVFNIQRSATRNTNINGYFIPKGTIVSVANYSIHHDPRYWDDPHKFYPERFLDDSATKYTAPKQGFFAFGSGRRQCVGELLARMELFLFTAAIIQHFDVRPPHGVDISQDEFVTLAGSHLPSDKKLIYRSRISTSD
ncbi:Cytochrome P450 CYP3214A3 [Hyalella azteca]|uniref:Cytochrome P450 2L1 isoform X1 n=1 Tax=Hyalella azteca TaxID=294128 RepID=A0A6A0GU18_HYAAZ|nr:cytochrome P450 2L1 isoform X1 [Hyalella azteca]KAA0188387.1 Cytochrome P450 CYP3214A3 [Hyalella azteca]